MERMNKAILWKNFFLFAPQKELGNFKIETGAKCISGYTKSVDDILSCLLYTSKSKYWGANPSSYMAWNNQKRSARFFSIISRQADKVARNTAKYTVEEIANEIVELITE